MTPLVHKHVIIRAEVLSPPTDEKLVSDSVKDLIERIGMKLLMGPYAKYVTMPGNRGLTVAAIIETSHIVMHTWDECNPAMIQLDVYTCGPFDPEIVFDWLKQYMPTHIDHKYIDREFGINEISTARPHNYSTEEIIVAMDKILNL
jgi:S-adenosylmethionine decarboxylase